MNKSIYQLHISDALVQSTLSSTTLPQDLKYPLILQWLHGGIILIFVINQADKFLHIVLVTQLGIF